MTLAVTAVRSYVREVDEPTTNRFLQTLAIETTGANTDVTYDFGLYVAGSLGTFWTAVGADSSYGQTALGLIRTIAAQSKTFLNVTGTALNGRTPKGAGGPVYYTSSAIGAGSASVTATVTGLASGDVVMSVTQKAANANSLVPIAYGAVGSNSLALTYSADPGANGTVQVVAYRGSGTQQVGIGQYGIATSNAAANITFASTDAPTSATFYLTWELQGGVHGIKYVAVP